MKRILKNRNRKNKSLKKLFRKHKNKSLKSSIKKGGSSALELFLIEAKHPIEDRDLTKEEKKIIEFIIGAEKKLDLQKIDTATFLTVLGLGQIILQNYNEDTKKICLCYFFLEKDKYLNEEAKLNEKDKIKLFKLIVKYATAKINNEKMVIDYKGINYFKELNPTSYAVYENKLMLNYVTPIQTLIHFLIERDEMYVKKLPGLLSSEFCDDESGFMTDISNKIYFKYFEMFKMFLSGQE